MTQALADVRADAAFFQKHFIAPNSLSAGLAAVQAALGQSRARWACDFPPQPAALPTLPPPPTGPPPAAPRPKGGKAGRDGKGARKGAGKGQDGKGVRTGWRTGESKFTPDNRRKCDNFNRRQGCRRANCEYLHCCMVCNGPHPVLECPRRPAPAGDAAGRPANLGAATPPGMPQGGRPY